MGELGLAMKSPSWPPITSSLSLATTQALQTATSATRRRLKNRQWISEDSYKKTCVVHLEGLEPLCAIRGELSRVLQLRSNGHEQPHCDSLCFLPSHEASLSISESQEHTWIRNELNNRRPESFQEKCEASRELALELVVKESRAKTLWLSLTQRNEKLVLCTEDHTALKPHTHIVRPSRSRGANSPSL